MERAHIVRSVGSMRSGVRYYQGQGGLFYESGDSGGATKTVWAKRVRASAKKALAYQRPKRTRTKRAVAHDRGPAALAAYNKMTRVGVPSAAAREMVRSTYGVQVRKKKGCGCSAPKPKPKKACCSSCARGLPCSGGCNHKHSDEAQDKRLFKKLIREEERRLGIMATRKKTKKKATSKKRKTTAKRRKKSAPSMSRKQACVVLCREKYLKKSRKKK